jgi:hypothetical protein
LKTLITTEVVTPAREVEEDGAFPATCLDLGLTGMVFTFSRPLPPGRAVIVTLGLPGGNVCAYAKVLRCETTRRAGKWKIAVQFDALFEDDQQRIAAYVEAEKCRRLD